MKDLEAQYPKRFYLNRKVDKTGISGTGRVLDGVMFTDGRISCRWRSDRASTNNYESLEDFIYLHVDNHGEGANELVWIDD